MQTERLKIEGLRKVRNRKQRKEKTKKAGEDLEERAKIWTLKLKKTKRKIQGRKSPKSMR